MSDRASVIYILDDDNAVLEALSSLVRSIGLSVECFSSASVFLNDVNRSACGCLILDVRMPEMSGLDVQRQLKELGEQIPIIFISGHGDIPMAVKAIKAGAADYVIKTVNDDFLPLLTSAIEQSVANAQLRASKAKADEEIRLGKERAEALLAEVNHRVANSLALVASLLRLQISSARSDEVKAELAETQARISAIAFRRSRSTLLTLFI